MTSATEQVITTLQATTIPVEGQAFLLAIFGGDLGGGGECPDPNPSNGASILDPWKLEVGYTYWDGGLATFPPWGGLHTDNMPPGEVSTAIGPFQLTHTTWLFWKTLPGAPEDFQPASQCLICWLGAENTYHGRNLLSDLQAGLLGNIQTALRSTWPGGTQGFTTRYPRALDLVKTPIKPPTPPPPMNVTVTLTAPLVLPGLDQDGNPATVTVTVSPTAHQEKAFVIPFASSKESDK